MGRVLGYRWVQVLLIFAIGTAPAYAQSSLNFVGPSTYQISGNSVQITISEISNTSSTYTSGSLRLDLWALQQPFSGGGFTGYQTANIRTLQLNGLADQLRPNQRFLNITLNLPYSAPAAGYTSYVLMLMEYSLTCTTADRFCVVAWINYNSAPNPNPNPTPTPTPSGNLTFVGPSSYQISGTNVQISISEIRNTSSTYTSGSLRLDLWALQQPYAGGTFSGYQTASIRTMQLTGLADQLGPNQRFFNITLNLPYRPPAAGYASYVLMLMEFSSTCTTADRYCAVAYINYTSPTPTPTPIGTVTVVEYYSAILNHYFVSAAPAEQAFLDAGGVPDFRRTGEQFKALPLGTGGTASVCRFYSPWYNSHFYTASSEECVWVRANLPDWSYERTEFGIRLPINSSCPAGIPVYRAFNNRAGSYNHRFTTSVATYQQMINTGWRGEGVVMCSEP